MKKLIGSDLGSYTFNKTAHTVSLTGLPMTLVLPQVLLITNVTSNIMIYNFASNPIGGTINNNVITLNYDTSGMADTDILQIFIDMPSDDDSLHAFLRRLVGLMESNAVVDSSGRQRIIIDAIATAAVTNTTGLGPSAVGNTPGSATPNVSSSIPMLTVSEGPVDQRWRIIDSTQTSYAVAMRTQLSW